MTQLAENVYLPIIYHVYNETETSFTNETHARPFDITSHPREMTKLNTVYINAENKWKELRRWIQKYILQFTQ